MWEYLFAFVAWSFGIGIAAVILGIAVLLWVYVIEVVRDR